MVTTRSLAMAAATLLLSASTVVGATTPTRVKREIGTVSAVATVAIPGETMLSMGCFSSSEGMTWTFSYNFMSSAQCQIACLNNNLPVVGLSAKSDCYCGNTAPPKSALVSDSNCNVVCDGYGAEMCGGANTTAGGVYLTVYDDQLESAEPGYYSVSSSTTTSSSSTKSTSSSATAGGNQPTSTMPSVVTVSGQVVYVTSAAAAASAASAASASAESAANHKSNANVVGIAVGVVVGVVGAAAIAVGVFLFIRRRKHKELEEEHKRQVAQSAFLNNGKPGSSGGDSLPDSRLDPAVLRERRLSDGSIMDNQDYSRRILQVRNL